MSSDTLVSICLPVRNGGATIEDVIRSVLAQDHEHIELVISDNASTDETADICREFARSDARIAYHRQPENIGLLNNFMHAMCVAGGSHFRWIGDDDALETDYVTRCLQEFAGDPRLILVTTGIAYTGPDGDAQTARYDGTLLRSDDPAERLTELLRVLSSSYMLVDPLYGMMRRDRVLGIPRRNMLGEDEVFATKLALAGPWGHIPQVLAHRHRRRERIGTHARRLGVPSWQSHLSNTLQCREMLAWLSRVDLTNGQRSRARRAVYRMYAGRQHRMFSHRSRKLMRVALGR